MDTERTVDRVVGTIGDLPAMPAIVAEVLRVTEDPSSEMEEVSRTVQADPALTAKILRVSNSSYYGMKQFVGTLKLALVILGVREIRNIVLGISVFETLRKKGADVRTAEEIWAQSLRVAGIAKSLGGEMGLGLQGEEFITGLLHDIGKMVLICYLGDEYSRLYNDLKLDQQGLYDAEQAEYGFTNADVALALANRWNLPQSLGDALWHQYPNPERPLAKAKDPKLAAVVRVAKRAARDDFATGGGQNVSALQDVEAWDILATAKRPIPLDQRLAVLANFVEEVLNGPDIPLS